ncbi:hypothetical protein G9A89_018503 [Geosiphon pyriformis]|nr:hypothetical protein G9A89_018503 [Geosiphon pyriformis]
MSSTPPTPSSRVSGVSRRSGPTRAPVQFRSSVFNQVHLTNPTVTYPEETTEITIPPQGFHPQRQNSRFERDPVFPNNPQYPYNSRTDELENGRPEGPRRGQSILGRERPKSHEAKKRLNTIKRRKSEKDSQINNNNKKKKKKKEWPTCWIIFCYAVTFYAPPFILSTIGRMKTPEIQRAWREKIGLISVIIVICLFVAFLTFGFTQVVCGKPPTRLRGGTVNGGTVIINGFAYNLDGFKHPGVQSYNPPIAPNSNPAYRPVNAGGKDISFMFQKVNFRCKGILTSAPGSKIKNENGNLAYYFPCIMLEQNGSTKATELTKQWVSQPGCHTSETARRAYFALKKTGEVFYTWDDIAKPGRNLAVYNGYVLDLERLKWLDPTQINIPPIFNNLTNPNNIYSRRDASLMFMNTDNKRIAECLADVLRIGSIDTKTMGCIASDIVLYISLIFIVGVVFIKFLLAVIFGWCLSWRLGAFKPESYEERMKRAAEIEAWSEDINKPASPPNRKSRFLPMTSRFSNAYNPRPSNGSQTSQSKTGAYGGGGGGGNGRRSPYGKTSPKNLLYPPGGSTPRISPNASPSGSPTLGPTRSNLNDDMNNASSSSLPLHHQEYSLGTSLTSDSKESLGNCPFPSTHIVAQPPAGYQPFNFPLTHTICLITAYSESEQGLRSTLDSIAMTDYPNSHKVVLVIADGIITGGGNSMSTPDILLSLMHNFAIPPEEVEAHSYVAIADGTKRHNRAKVFSGFYKYDQSKVDVSKQQRVPMVLVVKCGAEEEQNLPKPGNRGKRDSQIILMGFLQKVMFDERMTPFEYEFFNGIWRVTGVSPDKYEIVLMVDADTKIYPDSLSRMISCMIRDNEIMGLCGETKIANKTDSIWTMIQVFEYYISHHQSKAFESIFGGVTCLPGCFCMYRIKAPKGPDGYWVPILANPDIVENYSENIVDTLHKKNLLLLGEDRFLTTLMLRTFPKRKMLFVPQAVCKTIVPDSFKVLLSQRRRWINSTVHNLMELILVRDLCGTFCFSMQFVIFMELVGTVVLPAAISFTIYLVIISFFVKPLPIIPLLLLAAILGLPAILILMTSRKVVYVGWMLIYLLSLPIWNFLLPIYAYWHFDDFTWGATRRVEGDKGKGDHSAKDGEFDSSKIVMKRWVEFERERQFKEAIAKGLPPPQFLEDMKMMGMMRKSHYSTTESFESLNTNESSMPLTRGVERSRDTISNTELDSSDVSPNDYPMPNHGTTQEKEAYPFLTNPGSPHDAEITEIPYLLGPVDNIELARLPASPRSATPSSPSFKPDPTRNNRLAAAEGDFNIGGDYYLSQEEDYRLHHDHDDGDDDDDDDDDDVVIGENIPVGVQHQTQRRIRHSVTTGFPPNYSVPSPTNSTSSRHARYADPPRHRDGSASPGGRNSPRGSPRMSNRDTYYSQQVAREAAVARQNSRDFSYDQPARPQYPPHRERRGSQNHSPTNSFERSRSFENPTLTGPRYYNDTGNSANRQSTMPTQHVRAASGNVSPNDSSTSNRSTRSNNNRRN